MGLFKPGQIRDLVIEPEDDPEWTEEELGKLSQLPLFGNAPPSTLEKIPYRFSYRFQCHHQSCRGHKLMCTDWEIGMLYRRCRDQYGGRWEVKLREKVERQFLSERDTHFYVGTVHRHPDSWIIVGLYYPPLPMVEAQGRLLD